MFLSKELLQDLVIAVEGYAARPDTVYLCSAGCSHCCQTGAFFAVTLLEAIHLRQGICQMSSDQREQLMADAHCLQELTAGVRDERFPELDRYQSTQFRRYVSAVAKLGSKAKCPLLNDHLCGVYRHRPVPCRLLSPRKSPSYKRALEDAADQDQDRTKGDHRCPFQPTLKAEK